MKIGTILILSEGISGSKYYRISMFDEDGKVVAQFWSETKPEIQLDLGNGNLRIIGASREHISEGEKDRVMDHLKFARSYLLEAKRNCKEEPLREKISFVINGIDVVLKEIGRGDGRK